MKRSRSATSPIQIAHVRVAVDGHGARHEVMPALAEPVEALVLVGVDGNEHVDVGTPANVVRVRCECDREHERGEDDPAHASRLRPGRASLKPLVDRP